MSDRELLEKAAKAAGMFLDDHSQEYVDEVQGMKGWRYWFGRDGEIAGAEAFTWNPLTDDGDALRLAVTLGFAFDIETACGCVDVGPGSVIERFQFDDHQAACAATRRAIVRAAATGEHHE